MFKQSLQTRLTRQTVTVSFKNTVLRQIIVKTWTNAGRPYLWRSK